MSNPTWYHHAIITGRRVLVHCEQVSPSVVEATWGGITVSSDDEESAVAALAYAHAPDAPDVYDAVEGDDE